MKLYRKSRNSMRLLRVRTIIPGAAIMFFLTFTVTLSATPAWDIFLDADTPLTGSLLGTQSLVTSFGTVTFDGMIRDRDNDPEFNAVGALGDVFNISDGTAELFFGFDIISANFIYGGNMGSILVEARDTYGVVIDSFFQSDTYGGQPAGPVALSGDGIRSLYWEDPSWSFCALDNIGIVVPEPATVLLLGLGGLVLRRRKLKEM